MRKNTIFTALLLSLGLSVSAGTPPESDTIHGPMQPAQQEQPAAQESEIQALMVELQQLSQRIETAQQKARESDEVQEALIEYAHSLEEQMLEIEPEQEESIKRKGALMVEMIRLDDPSTMSENEQDAVREKVQEHQQLATTLASVQAEALETDEVQAKQEAARQIQIEKMQELEPNLMQIVQQRSELVQRIQALHGHTQVRQPTSGQTDS